MDAHPSRHLSETEKHVNLAKRFAFSLFIEGVLASCEAIIQVVPIHILLKAVGLSALVTAVNAVLLWVETPRHHRPRWMLLSLLGLWGTGWAFLFGLYSFIIIATANNSGSILPAVSTPNLPGDLPGRVPLPPTSTSTPTITPSPTYTFTPTPTITLSPTYTFTPPPTPTPIVIVVTPTPTFTPTLPYGYEKVCQDAPPSPLAVGRPGYICNQDKIIIRSKPSARAKVIGSLEPGTRFKVIGGPECGDRRVWWRVRLYIEADQAYTGMIGWMPESSPGGDERYLCAGYPNP